MYYIRGNHIRSIKTHSFNLYKS